MARPAAVVVALAVSALLPTAAPAAVRDGHFYPCGPGQAPPFSDYWLGDSYETLPMTYSYYECTRPRPPAFTRAHSMLYAYDDCAPGETDCDTEVQVLTSPACEHNLMRYTLYGGGFRPGEPIHYHRTHARGVPGIYVIEDPAGSARLELYTGDVTVVLFADSLADARRAARELHTPPASALQVAAGEALPRPVRGHLRGTLDCGMRLRGPGRRLGEFCTGGPGCDQPGVALTLRSPRRGYAAGQLSRRRRGSRGPFKPFGHVQFPLKRGLTTHRFRRAFGGISGDPRVASGEYRLLLGATDRTGRSARTRVARFVVK